MHGNVRQVALLGAALALAAGTAKAQDADLREFIEAYVEGELFVGTMPDGFPLADVVPDGARVIGTVVQGHGTTLILGVRGSPREAEGRVREALAARGWTPPPGGTRAPGFVSTFEPSTSTVCRHDGVVSLRFSAATAGQSHARLTLAAARPGTGRSVCDGPFQPPTPRGMEGVPSLEAPPGTRSRGGGLSSGSDGGHEARAELETSATVPELAAHYDAQLREQGWEPVTERTDAVVALHTYTRIDAAGRRMHGMLLLLAPPGAGGRIGYFRITPLAGAGR